MSRLTFELSTTPPYRLDLVARIIQRRPENLVDHWDGRAYRRVFVFDDLRPVSVLVTQVGSVDDPRLLVVAEAGELSTADESALTAILRRALSLDLDLAGFYAFAALDPKFSELVAPYRGMRIPRFPTLFETVACAVACQQVTLSFGMTLVSRLCERYGGRAMEEGLAFPTADRLATVDPVDLKSLAFSGAKARAIVDAAREMVSGDLREVDLEAMDNQAAIDRLMRMRGVGQWTAEYILLRGLGRIDCFPAGDAGGRSNLAHWLGIAEKLDYDAVRALIAPWSAYAGVLFFLLMLRRRDISPHVG